MEPRKLLLVEDSAKLRHVLRIALETIPGGRALLASGPSGRKHIAEGYNAGCDDYLEMPYLLDTLLKRLDRLCPNRYGRDGPRP